MLRRILVWDWPQRVGHWLLAACVAIAWATAESDRLQLLHVLAGGCAGGIAAFRVLWGLVGSRHARFVNFLHGPTAVFGYLRSLLRRHPEVHSGHNPAGGWAVLALLLLVLATAGSGWATYNDLAGHWLEELHEGLAEGLLLLVGVHLGAVMLSSWRHRENLLRAMFDGHKQGPASEAIGSPRAWAVPLLLAAGALAAYLAQAA